MRKHLIRTTLIATILATSLAFTACGKDDTTTNAKATTKVEASDGELETTTLEEDETSSNEIVTTNEKETTTKVEETTTMETTTMETTTVAETTTMETTTIVETTTVAETTQAPVETPAPTTPAPTQPATEAPTEPVTEAPQETPAPTQPPTEAPTQPQTEAPVVEESPEVKKIKSLHIANRPPEADDITMRIDPELGYVFEAGPTYRELVDYVDEDCGDGNKKCPYKMGEWTTRKYWGDRDEETLGFYCWESEACDGSYIQSMKDKVRAIYDNGFQGASFYNETIGIYEGKPVCYQYCFLSKYV